MARKEAARFQEIWAKTGEQAMCALINGDRGWLMYLPGPGEAGFSSRNPRYDGLSDAVIEYVLENGQRDSYPASWAYPLSEVERALECFRREKKRPPFIEWHAD